MKTLSVPVGKRTPPEFKRITNELKGLHFRYNPASKEWEKSIEEDRVEHWITQFKNVGIKAYIKD